MSKPGKALTLAIGIGLLCAQVRGSADDGAARGPSDPAAAQALLQFDGGLHRPAASLAKPVAWAQSASAETAMTVRKPEASAHEGHGGGRKIPQARDSGAATSAAMSK